MCVVLTRGATARTVRLSADLTVKRLISTPGAINLNDRLRRVPLLLSLFETLTKNVFFPKRANRSTCGSHSPNKALLYETQTSIGYCVLRKALCSFLRQWTNCNFLIGTRVSVASYPHPLLKTFHRSSVQFRPSSYRDRWQYAVLHVLFENKQGLAAAAVRFPTFPWQQTWDKVAIPVQSPSYIVRGTSKRSSV